MELEQIKQHWSNWASEFKDDIRATTRTSTIKSLEIAALARAIRNHGEPDLSQILEVGCGNGHNLFGLAEQFANISFQGIDFIPDMIESAKQIQASCPTPDAFDFSVGNILSLEENDKLAEHYPLIFTNRCIINLNTHELQLQAVSQLNQKLQKNGLLLLLENQTLSHGNQNDLRESVGLPRREVAEFNVFMDQTALLSHTEKLGLRLLEIDNFASLHDVLLYVLIPMINDGQVDYKHPIMNAATELLLKNGHETSNSFGTFGQNQLLIFKKES